MPRGVYDHSKHPGNRKPHLPNSGNFRKGQPGPWLGKKRPDVSGANHHNWRGGIAKDKTHRMVLQQNREARKRDNGGSHTVAEWATLKAQYNWTCPACRQSEPKIKLTEDHIIPVSRGGSNNIENIQPLCGSCNSKKKVKIIVY